MTEHTSNIDRLLAGDDEELKDGIVKLLATEERAKPIVSAFTSVVTVEENVDVVTDS